jgi:hypothetical protein
MLSLKRACTIPIESFLPSIFARALSALSMLCFLKRIAGAGLVTADVADNFQAIARHTVPRRGLPIRCISAHRTAQNLRAHAIGAQVHVAVPATARVPSPAISCAAFRRS